MKSYKYIEKIELRNKAFKKIKNGYGAFDSLNSIYKRDITNPFKDEDGKVCEVKTLTENEYNITRIKDKLSY